MEITRSTVPSRGVIHQCVTRAGERLGVIVDDAGSRQIVLYEWADSETPLRTIALEPDEADQLADVLHTRPLVDRVSSLERRLGELAGSRS